MITISVFELEKRLKNSLEIDIFFTLLRSLRVVCIGQNAGKKLSKLHNLTQLG